MMSTDDLTLEHVVCPSAPRLGFNKPLPDVEDTEMMLWEEDDIQIEPEVATLSATAEPIAFEGYRGRQRDDLCDEMDNMSLGSSYGSSRSSTASSLFSSYGSSVGSAATSFDASSFNPDKCESVPPRSFVARYASLQHTSRAPSMQVASHAILETQDHLMLESENVLGISLYGKPAGNDTVFNFDQELSELHTVCAPHAAVEEGYSPERAQWLWHAF